MNDLHLSTKFNVRLFADDACLTIAHKDHKQLEVNINNELENVNLWLQTNKLFLNYAKTNYLIFKNGKKNFSLNISINNHTLQETHKTKYLGIQIDNNLNWNAHIENLQKVLSRGCYALYKLKQYANESVLKSVYYSLVYSKLQYCITSWGGCSETRLSPLLKLQKRALRSICKVPFGTPTHPLFVNLKMLKLKDVYKLKVCTLVKQVNDNNLCGDLNLTNLDSIHNYNTRIRHNANFYLHPVKTNLGKNAFSYIGPKFWQSVPNHIKPLPIQSFKYKLKKHLLGLYEEESS